MMAEPKFTPGPWVIVDNSDLNGALWIASDDGSSLAEVRPGCEEARELGDNEANAHLIRTAPDLYEMTDLLERYIVYEIKRAEKDGDDEGARLKSFTLAQVRAVLANARGETPRPLEGE